MSNSRSEVNPIVSASGDDEELKEALDDHAMYMSFAAVQESGSQADINMRESAGTARQAIQSLFGRIREERDRLIEERRLDAGWMYAHELEGENASLQAELGRIREELKDAQNEIDDCVDRYCGVCVSCRSLAVFMGVCRACTFKQNDAPKLIESLRSSSLTVNEAECVEHALRSRATSDWVPEFRAEIESACVKLRRHVCALRETEARSISGGALKEGATQ